mmetsp:Transcript_39629/g.126630  ORF Transcript_39629/g.126630 Transcript_39629/m.126630 type:complete len:232 (+) Transcript_39629:128-823(+)
MGGPSAERSTRATMPASGSILRTALTLSRDAPCGHTRELSDLQAAVRRGYRQEGDSLKGGRQRGGRSTSRASSRSASKAIRGGHFIKAIGRVLFSKGALEILGRGNLLVCQLGYACRNRPEDRLHHSQVLEVVMGLKQRLACEELEQDASDAPDITRVGPPQTEDDFRRSVVPRRHDAAVVLIVEGCIPEVDELDLAAHRHPHRAGPRWARLFGVIVRHQQDVLWFEIRVH